MNATYKKYKEWNIDEYIKAANSQGMQSGQQLKRELFELEDELNYIGLRDKLSFKFKKTLEIVWDTHKGECCCNHRFRFYEIDENYDLQHVSDKELKYVLKNIPKIRELVEDYLKKKMKSGNYISHPRWNIDYEERIVLLELKEH